MNPLPGQSIDVFPIAGLLKIRDLEYYDGPLLSQFKHDRGDHYLYYWCDCDQTANRWMVLRVSETSIIRLLNRFTPLDYIIPQSCQDDFVYFIDLDELGSLLGSALCLIDQIPVDYQPRPGVYLDYEPARDDRSYSVLIEGSLTNEQLSEIPSRYTQAYSFLYVANVLQRGQHQSFPWRGGFSSMHFYRGLPNLVPAEDRAKVEALQYASPGFIRFSIHRPTASSLGKRIAKYLDRQSPEHQCISRLLGYIAENKLNDLREEHRNTTDPEWERYNAELFSRTRELLESLEISEPQRLMPAMGSSFEVAKMTLSFTRRLSELTGFVRDGLVRFPEM
jgi:hypothetical protein